MWIYRLGFINGLCVTVIFIPYNSCILEKSISGTTGRTRWTNSMVSLFPLRLVSTEISKVYSYATEVSDTSNL